MKLTFGKHKGKELSTVPSEYLRWLTEPKLKDGGMFDVPEEIKQEAKNLLARKTFADDRLAGKPCIVETYVIERLGDISGLTIHDTLEEALKQLEAEYPIIDGIREWTDPEDNRILVWEILPSGHKKVVWHFSGWHWDADEFYELDQGKLGNDIESLYSIACKDC